MLIAMTETVYQRVKKQIPFGIIIFIRKLCELTDIKSFRKNANFATISGFIGFSPEFKGLCFKTRQLIESSTVQQDNSCRCYRNIDENNRL